VTHARHDCCRVLGTWRLFFGVPFFCAKAEIDDDTAIKQLKQREGSVERATTSALPANAPGIINSESPHLARRGNLQLLNVPSPKVDNLHPAFHFHSSIPKLVHADDCARLCFDTFPVQASSNTNSARSYLVYELTIVLPQSSHECATTECSATSAS
jgi:hypothetical protein